MTRKAVFVGSPVAGAPYTPGIIVGDLVFVSGQIPIDPSTGAIVAGEFEDRVRRCILNVGAVLEQAGSDLEHVVKVVVFLTDMENFARMNRVYAEYWGPVKPARSCVQVAGLPLGADVEMEAIAILKR
ncbi:MAG: Rid family detoxifying hydrolase [Chthonomonadales bacterium]